MTLVASKDRFYLKLQGVGCAGGFDLTGEKDRQGIYIRNVSKTIFN